MLLLKRDAQNSMDRECNEMHSWVSFTLDKANLSHSSFVDARLHKASLRESYLIKADFAEADLTEADLTNADLRGAYFNMLI